MILRGDLCSGMAKEQVHNLAHRLLEDGRLASRFPLGEFHCFRQSVEDTERHFDAGEVKSHLIHEMFDHSKLCNVSLRVQAEHANRARRPNQSKTFVLP